MPELAPKPRQAYHATVAPRDRLHSLVDRLPRRDVGAARRFLEYLVDRGPSPLDRALAGAPADDEPETAAEARAIAAAMRDVRAGRIVPSSAIRADLRRR